jgi:hypothetical protein
VFPLIVFVSLEIFKYLLLILFVSLWNARLRLVTKKNDPDILIYNETIIIHVLMMTQ